MVATFEDVERVFAEHEAVASRETDALCHVVAQLIVQLMAQTQDGILHLGRRSEVVVGELHGDKR